MNFISDEFKKVEGEVEHLKEELEGKAEPLIKEAEADAAEDAKAIEGVAVDDAKKAVDQVGEVAKEVAEQAAAEAPEVVSGHETPVAAAEHLAAEAEADAKPVVEEDVKTVEDQAGAEVQRVEDQVAVLEGPQTPPAADNLVAGAAAQPVAADDEEAQKIRDEAKQLEEEAQQRAADFQKAQQDEIDQLHREQAQETLDRLK
jgi:colicin import membrane protein